MYIQFVMPQLKPHEELHPHVGTHVGVLGKRGEPEQAFRWLCTDKKSPQRKEKCQYILVIRSIKKSQAR